jgi:uncharacterized Zn finger protein
MFDEWAPYVPVAERRRKAAGAMAKLAKKGQSISPVVVQGRAIANTAWGKAWCANMESYSDYANRLPRGRTYVRNGSVVDLQITPGTVAARVSGSSIYRTTITVTPVPKAKWQQLCADCAGGIDSLVELLQGRFSKGVMDRLCRQGDGLFPMPKDIRFDCSCPDGATMCKHVAAVLYGVGARFDSQPELLFTLRQVDPAELLSKAGSGVVTAPAAGERTLAGDDIGALFGLEMDGSTAAPTAAPTKPPAAAKPVGLARPGAKLARPSAKLAQPSAKQARARDPASRLLAALRRAGSLDNAAARAATGLDAEAVRPLLRQLVADGHARVQGQRRGTRYVAVGKALKA